MKVTGAPGRYEFNLEGPISEKATIFDYKITDATEIVVDFDKMTFINSVGVKNWTLWVLRIPVTAKVMMKNCPGLIMNQIAMIPGFLPRKCTITSVKAPYVCANCSAEKSMLFTIDNEYAYATPTAPARITLPEKLECVKCKGELEPDFLQERFFTFLRKT